MARHIQQGSFKSGSGEIISGGTVTVYLAGTTTLATIYTALSGGSADSDSAVTSGTDGHWYFYVDELDYLSNQKFKYILSYAGFTSKTYDDITIFPELATSVVTKTTTYTALLTDDVILADGTFTITLPSVTTTTGKPFTVKNIGTGTITISPNVDGASLTILPDVTSVIQSDGTIYRSLTDYNSMEFIALSGTNTYTATLAHAPAAYVTNRIYPVVFTNAATVTNPTVNLNSLGAKTIKDQEGNALLIADIPANLRGILVYDGTDMRLLNPRLPRGGTWTPTATLVANLDTCVPAQGQWMRVSNTVTGSVEFAADGTTGSSTATRVRFSLPVSSDFAGTSDASGVILTANAADAGVVLADITNNELELLWLCITATNITFRAVFSYEVI